MTLDSNTGPSTGPDTFARAAVRSFRQGGFVHRAWVILGVGATGLGFILVSLNFGDAEPAWLKPFAYSLVTSGILIFVSLSSYWRAVDADVKQEAVQYLEERIRDNPTEPKLAWDLARVKLEDYLDRNLKQVSAIFFLILLVMGFGMILVSVGVWQSIQRPQTLAPAALAALAGVLIQFIGGTFLIIYRSTMDQAKSYVVVLERINAVGMSINILESIETQESDIRDRARAELAKELLGMYRTSHAPLTTPKRRSGPNQEG